MNKIIVVSGPTASGKTALAVELAKLYGGEVISADSMQIYTDMDVASAKATPEEQQGIPHHLMNFLDPSQSFSVAEWVGMAGKCADDILARGKTPIICGGTGLYISSFVDNLQFDDSECDYAYRGELRRFAEENGAAALLEKLREVDPETAAELHENNVSRVIRALEVYKTTGHTIAQAKRESRNAPSPYEFILLTLDFERKRKIVCAISVGKFITVLVHECVQESNVRRLVEFDIVAPDEIHYLIIALGDDFKSHLIGKKQRRVIERLFL